MPETCRLYLSTSAGSKRSVVFGLACLPSLQGSLGVFASSLRSPACVCALSQVALFRNVNTRFRRPSVLLLLLVVVVVEERALSRFAWCRLRNSTILIRANVTDCPLPHSPTRPPGGDAYRNCLKPTAQDEDESESASGVAADRALERMSGVTRWP